MQVVQRKHFRHEYAGFSGDDGFLYASGIGADYRGSGRHGFDGHHSEIFVFRHENRRDRAGDDAGQFGVVLEDPQFDVGSPFRHGGDFVLLGIVDAVHDQEFLIGHFLERADDDVDALEGGQFRERNVVVALFRRIAGNEFRSIDRRIEDFGLATEVFETIRPEIFAVHVDFRNLGEISEKILRYEKPHCEVGPLEIRRNFGEIEVLLIEKVAGNRMEVADFYGILTAFRDRRKRISRENHHVVPFQEARLEADRQFEEGVTRHSLDPVRELGVQPSFHESGGFARLGERPARERYFLPFESHGIEIEASLVEVRGGDVGSGGLGRHYVEPLRASAIEKKVVENADFRFGHIVWGGILSAESYTSLILCKAL